MSRKVGSDVRTNLNSESNHAPDLTMTFSISILLFPSVQSGCNNPSDVEQVITISDTIYNIEVLLKASVKHNNNKHTN